MRKYWIIFKMRLQSKLSYRWKVFFESFLRLLPTLVLIFVWERLTSVYGAISGYKYDDFVAYYILTFATGFFSRTGLMWEIDIGVRKGEFTSKVLKPVSLIGVLFSDMIARLFSKILMRAPSLLFLGIAIKDVRENIQIGLWEFGLVFLYLLIFFVFAFIWELAWSQFIFIMKEMGGIAGIVWNLGKILSGSILPLDLLPPIIYKIFMFLPFANGIYLSISFILGRSDLYDLLIGLSKVIVASLVVGIFVRIVWPKIIKNYVGVGI
jgi:ABC-2 type transport system permease protein